MNKKYEEWIEAYAKRHRYLVGMCTSAVHEMQKEFPELIIVKGWALVVLGGHPEHAWCTTPEGEIVDPTLKQFDGKLVLKYTPWKPGDRVRMGRCMNCGDDIYGTPDTLDGDRKTVCSRECEDILLAEFNGDA